MSDPLREALEAADRLAGAVLTWKRGTEVEAAAHEYHQARAALSAAPASLDDGPWQQMSDAATPGPWVVSEKRGKRDGYIKGADGRTVADMRLRNGSADAALIVKAVNALRAALEGAPHE